MIESASILLGGGVFFLPIIFTFIIYSYIYIVNSKIRAMKGKMILAIITAISALALTIWCFIDGTYYIGAFALCICIAQIFNYIVIKRKAKNA